MEVRHVILNFNLESRNNDVPRQWQECKYLLNCRIGKEYVIPSITPNLLILNINHTASFITQQLADLTFE